MHSIKQEWDDFRAKILDGGCTEHELELIHVAFYQGIYSLMDIMTTCTSPEGNIKMIRLWQKELNEFFGLE
jgi:hypothetical protein